MNPFITRLRAEGYRRAGDYWADLARTLAARARECWAKSEALLGQVEAEQRRLARDIRARAESDAAWAEAETAIRDALERRDEAHAGTLTPSPRRT